MAKNITTWPFSKDDVFVCEACSKQVKSSDCELLEGTLLEVFEVVLIKLNFISTQPVICKDCNKKLLDAFERKSKWIYTEDRLFPYINSPTEGKVDIKTVYLDKSCCKQSDFKSEIQICRLCIGLINDNSWNSLVGVLEKRYSLEIFKKGVPDLNLNATENPIICKRCLDSFSVFMDFITLCQGREVKTEEYLEELKMEEYFIEDKQETQLDCTNTALNQDLEQSKLEGDSKFHVEILKSSKYLQVPEDKIHLLGHELIRKSKKREKLVRSLSEVKLFKCEFCFFETKHKNSIQNHIFIHKSLSEVEVFNCDLCTYKTKLKRNLLRHILVHKTINSVKLFKCEFCFFKTKHKSSLQIHMLIHKPPSEVEVFKCDSCSYKTKYKGNLQSHVLIHKSLSKVEVFQCDLCSYKTRYKHNLQKHIPIHKPLSSVKVFKCEFCSFETIHEESRQHHLLVHKSLSL